MLRNYTFEQIQEAMALVTTQLDNGAGLKLAFRKAMLQTHPDKVADKGVSFRIINEVYKTILPILEKDTKLDQQQKLNLSISLKQLPAHIMNLIIQHIQKLNPTIGINDLVNPRISHISSTHYPHMADNPLKGRSHGLGVNSKKFPKLRVEFQGFKGDFLKTQILKDFKTQLENASSLDELHNLVKSLKASEEYKVLKTGQGFFTRLFGLATASAKAFDKMVAEQENKIIKNQPTSTAYSSSFFNTDSSKRHEDPKKNDVNPHEPKNDR